MLCTRCQAPIREDTGDKHIEIISVCSIGDDSGAQILWEEDYHPECYIRYIQPVRWRQ